MLLSLLTLSCLVLSYLVLSCPALTPRMQAPDDRVLTLHAHEAGDDDRFPTLTDAAAPHEAQCDKIQCQHQSVRKEAAVDHRSFLALREAAIAHEAKGDGT